jgi:hypothetical protein
VNEVEGYLPLFAHLFGMKPDEVYEMTVDRWELFRDYADEFTGGRGG